MSERTNERTNKYISVILEGGNLLVFPGAPLLRIGGSEILRSESSSGTEMYPLGQLIHEFWAAHNSPVLAVETMLGKTSLVG